MQANVSHLAKPPNVSLLDAADNGTDDTSSMPTERLLSLRVCISFCYCLVCTVGLLGNGLVMYLIKTRKGRSPSPIDVFVFCLALTDFQLALTLPFWAVDTFLDFSWPFGNFMCKIISVMTVLSVYTNVFLLTAMSVTRYWSVASAVGPRFRLSSLAAKWIAFGLWVVAMAAATPTAVFTMVKELEGEELCLLKFPDLRWLGVYHLHKVIVAFILPLVIITGSYLMLCFFLDQHYLKVSKLRPQREVTSSILLLVLLFFICWFPHHAATFWGVLVKFEVVPLSSAYYFFHTYLFPVATCLAHSSSCLNPILYYLMRKECRKNLKTTLWKIATHFFSCLPSAGPKQSKEHTQAAMPLNPKESLSCPQQPPQRGSKKCCMTSPIGMCLEKMVVSCQDVVMSFCLRHVLCVTLSSHSFVSRMLFSFSYVKKKKCIGPEGPPFRSPTPPAI